MCSVAGQCGPAVWVFSTSGFHRLFATKPVSSETKRLVGTDPCACIDPGRLTANPEVIPPDVLSGTRKSACHWRETGVWRNLTGSLLASQLAERNGFSAAGRRATFE